MRPDNDLSPQKILEHVRTIHAENYGDADLHIIETVFNDVIDLFSGKITGFQKCDTRYHDLLHTLQVIPPFIGIIDGWNKSKNTPRISKEYFDIGIIAVLLHDTGYIKISGDTGGTGGKYTFVHIQRSAEFAGHYLSGIGFDKNKIHRIQNIIMCTGVKIDFNNLPFQSEEERIIGYTLGTADLLGQMSAADYPEKLPALFSEFDEAYHYEGKEKLREMGMVIFESAEDLIKHTPSFYEVTVRERFEHMGSVYSYIPRHFNDSRNFYIEAIEANIEKIKKTYLA